MTVQAIQYNANTEIVAKHECETVDQAIEWCITQRGAKLELVDTPLGYHVMTEAELENVANSMWPPMWFEIHGLDEQGEIRELDEYDDK